jgi:hypothetical protein
MITIQIEEEPMISQANAPDLDQASDPGAGASSLLAAADLQDHLMAATNDLERLQRLLADTCDTLMARFHGTVEEIASLEGDCSTQARAQALLNIHRQLGSAITALQFQDVASQLIGHTHQRLRNCADQLARDAFGPDADGEAIVAPPPLRPNPVTQDEMDAGSIELF